MVVSCDRDICICISTDFSRRHNAKYKRSVKWYLLQHTVITIYTIKKNQFTRLESSERIGLAVRRRGEFPVEPLAV